LQFRIINATRTNTPIVTTIGTGTIGTGVGGGSGRGIGDSTGIHGMDGVGIHGVVHIREYSPTMLHQTILNRLQRWKDVLGVN
jgi:hypothetical protein